MQRNPRIMWVFGGAIAVVAIAVPVLIFLPGNMKVIGAAVLGVGMLSIYPVMLSGALKPKRVSVALVVDHSGVYADDAPLALRENIAEAYMRPPLDAQTKRFTSYGRSMPASYSIDLPSFPLTVELVLRRGGQLNIDPGGQGPASEILTALGFPVTICAPDHRPRTTGRQWIITVVVVVLFLAALFGFSIYKSTGH
jgi:hypothetical protein